jgi:small-conductance mechanosensitive channel
MVLTNNDYKLGDIIVIDDDHKEYFGRIEELTIRYTVLRTFDLRKVIVPNLTMVTKPIRTYDTEELVRLETNVTMHYDTPVEKAIDIIKKAVNGVKLVKEKHNTTVMMKAMGDHGLEMQVYFYLDPSA